MAIPQRRGAESKPPRAREFHGEQHAADLVRFLNARNKSASYRRVEALMETATAMLGITESTPSNKLSNSADKHYESLIRVLQKQLSRYPRTPLFVWEEDDGEWVIELISAVRGVPQREVNAVTSFLTISQLSLLRRIRRCKQCQKWIFARFPHQVCCTSNCRERYFRSSAEWKAKRRERARRYYRLHKYANTK